MKLNHGECRVSVQVYFRGVGMRELHELALCDEHDDGTTTVMYADRLWRGPSHELRHLPRSPEVYRSHAYHAINHSEVFV